METKKELTANEILENLQHFTGSTLYHRYQIGRGLEIKFTEGIYYLVEKANCYWLLDVIMSWQYNAEVRNNTFQVWRLKKSNNNSAIITCTDGNKNLLTKQYIQFTDFPLEEIEAWYVDGVCLLPGEY